MLSVRLSEHMFVIAGKSGRVECEVESVFVYDGGRVCVGRVCDACEVEWRCGYNSGTRSCSAECEIESGCVCNSWGRGGNEYEGK